MTDEWDGKERRMNPHNCIQVVPINDIKNSVSNIEKCIGQQDKRLTQALTLLFGENMDGGIVTKIKMQAQSLGRLWWFVGIIAAAFVINSVKDIFF